MFSFFSFLFSYYYSQQLGLKKAGIDLPRGPYFYDKHKKSVFFESTKIISKDSPPFFFHEGTSQFKNGVIYVYYSIQ